MEDGPQNEVQMSTKVKQILTNWKTKSMANIEIDCDSHDLILLLSLKVRDFLVHNNWDQVDNITIILNMLFWFHHFDYSSLKKYIRTHFMTKISPIMRSFH